MVFVDKEDRGTALRGVRDQVGVGADELPTQELGDRLPGPGRDRHANVVWDAVEGSGQCRLLLPFQGGGNRRLLEDQSRRTVGAKRVQP